MKYYIPLLFASSLLITSCKNDTEEKNSNVRGTVVPFTEVGNQMKAQSQSATTDQNSQNMNPSAVAAGMNPAHGQPGHRCEIPVGAPLNGAAPSNMPQKVAAPTPTVTTTAAPAETVVTAEGMNPPHGQANHRCDIAVGAPLTP